jgi:hypothetical protein
MEPAESKIVGAGLKKRHAPASRVSNAGGPHGFFIRSPEEAKRLNEHLRTIGQEAGQNYTARMESAMKNADQNAATAELTRLGLSAARNNQLHPKMEGHGLYAGRGFGSRREVSSVGVGGNLLARANRVQPALQSQPYAANWQFQFTLPPSYQKFNGGV